MFGKSDAGFPKRTCATEKEERNPFHSNGMRSRERDGRGFFPAIAQPLVGQEQ
jgi:hypothetical protein